LSRVRVRVSASVSVRVTVSVKVSACIINVYVEHRYLTVLHCISQRNGLEQAVTRGKLLLIACDRSEIAEPVT